MIAHYLTIAFRNLSKRKLFTSINISGLAISLTCCFFIIYFIYDELTFDRFHENADRIHRITTTFLDPPNTNRIRFTDQRVGPYLKERYPQVEEFVRFETYQGYFKLGQEYVKEEGVYYADPAVFKIFTLSFIEGDPETAFQKPNSIVLAETLARKYFGNEAMGSVLEIGKELFQVTGIVKDMPRNTDKWISGLIRGDFPSEGTLVKYDTYILFNSPAAAADIKPSLDQAAATIWNQKVDALNILYESQPLPALHFFQGIQMDNPKGNRSNIYIFMLIAGMLLLVAIFNFINLTMVKSLERVKEVGVRKVFGAAPRQVLKQFLGESMLVAGIAGVLALLLVRFLYSFFYIITGKAISFSLEGDLLLIGGTLILLVLASVIASAYPAFMVASFKPASILKGSILPLPQNKTLRKSLMVAQFTLSTVLLICLVVIVKQMDRMKKTDLGFNHEHVVVIESKGNPVITTNIQYLKNELLKNNAAIQFSSGDNQSLPSGMTGTTSIWFKQPGGEREMQPQNIVVDQHYPDLMQMKLTEGKTFHGYPESQLDKIALVNETFVSDAGWKDPVGQKIEAFSFEGRKEFTIVGVLKDFHYQSLHNTIHPVILFADIPENNPPWYIYLKVLPGGLEKMKATWKKVFPDQPLEYFFLDQSLNKQYKAEENLLILLTVFSLLTILLTGLGLFGVMTYATEVRIKEIGIRKTMGAGTVSLIGLLTKDFIKLAAIGSVLGAMLSFYAASEWLEKYSYRIDLDTWIFAIPVLAIILLAMGITALRTYAAARANPMNSLKYE